MMMRIARFLLACQTLTWLVATPADAGTLDRVRDTGTFRIGYRSDAKPYSYRNENAQPAGYIVDLCLEVAAAVLLERGAATRQHREQHREQKDVSSFHNC